MSHLTAAPWRLPRPRAPRSHLTAEPWPVPDAPLAAIGPVAVAGALTITAAAPAPTAAADPGASTAGAVVLGEVVLANAGSSHTVQRGETLSDIALRAGMTVGALAQVNGISNPDRIVAGQVLELSASSSGSADAARSHTVRRGETLSDIALRHGVSVASLVEVNGLADPSRIIAGEQLAISAPGSPGGASGASDAQPAPAPDGGGYHTVARGESLSSIAVQHGTTVAALAEANGLSNPNLVTVGQGLKVPGGAPGPAGPVCPVPGASYVDDFGYVKPSGRVHEGVDLYAPRGTAVGAPAAGVAQHVTGPRAGNQVTFDGDDGARYYLTHLDSFGKAGRVSAGEVIGTVGDTGNARGTSPHVHFERHVDGEPTNPYPWLTDRC